MAWRGIIAVGLGFLAGLGGCRTGPSGSPAETQAAGAGVRSQVVTATVRHIDVEGGFYGLVTDEGKKLDPVNLPKEFWKDGLRLEARVVPLRDRVSTHVWGTPVRIVEFQVL